MHFNQGSMMDVRSRNIADPDRRVGDRISQLSPAEIGYQRVKSLKVDGKKVGFKEVETILEVSLKNPIQPGQTVQLDMEFEAQVPCSN